MKKSSSGGQTELLRLHIGVWHEERKRVLDGTRFSSLDPFITVEEGGVCNSGLQSVSQTCRVVFPWLAEESHRSEEEIITTRLALETEALAPLEGFRVAMACTGLPGFRTVCSSSVIFFNAAFHKQSK
jgi:hypothetical protein